MQRRNINLRPSNSLRRSADRRFAQRMSPVVFDKRKGILVATVFLFADGGEIGVSGLTYIFAFVEGLDLRPGRNRRGRWRTPGTAIGGLVTAFWVPISGTAPMAGGPFWAIGFTGGATGCGSGCFASSGLPGNLAGTGAGGITGVGLPTSMPGMARGGAFRCHVWQRCQSRGRSWIRRLRFLQSRLARALPNLAAAYHSHWFRWQRNLGHIGCGDLSRNRWHDVFWQFAGNIRWSGRHIAIFFKQVINLTGWSARVALPVGWSPFPCSDYQGLS